MKRAKTLFADLNLRSCFLVTSLLVLLTTSLAPALVAQAAPTPTTTPAATQTTQQTKPDGTSIYTSTPAQDEEEKIATCDDAAGPLSFFLCPIYEQIMKLINWLAGPNDSVLMHMLRVEPLQFNKDTGLQRAYLNILNFVNGLFILVFLVIIFANFISDFSFLDSYNVKSTLPRLIAAIILAQFGYLICAAAIDMGNILGTVLPNAISQGVLGQSIHSLNITDGVVSLLAFGNPKIVGGGTAVMTTVLFGGGSGVVFLLLFIMAILAAFALLVAFFYMVARYLILILLIFATPLAFLAWVLPGTQPFFYKWGRNLIRLVMMFPLVAVLITTAEVVSFMLIHPSFDPTVFTDDRFKLLIGGLLPFVALLLIPKCLKISDDLFDFGAGAITGYIAGKGKEAPGKVKTMGVEGMQNRIASNDEWNKTKFGRLMVAGPAGLNSKSPKGAAKMGDTRDRAQAAFDKAAKYGTTDELKSMLNQNYRPAKIAALAALAKNGDRDAVRNALRTGVASEEILNAATKKDWDAFKGMPDLRSNWDFAAGDVKSDFYSGLNASTWGDSSGPTQKEWTMAGTMGADGKMSYSGYSRAKIERITASQWNSILQDKGVRGKMHEDARLALRSYANSHAGTAQAASINSNMNADGSWS